MIDLEQALAGLVEGASDPPDVATLTRRARQRRFRRRGTALAVALVIVTAGIAGTVALRSMKHHGRVILESPRTESVRVTMLDGSQLEISGPSSLGLTKLEPAFSAQLDVLSWKGTGPSPGHSFFVERTAPDEPGAIVGRYPTHDRHELVVHTTANGVDAVVHYEHWALVVSWNHDPANWETFAAALNARESVDGFLVIEPVDPSWQLGPTDAPDVQLGGTGYGGGAAFSFFGPSTYESGCPAAETTTHTPQGWPVSFVNGAWWCDADQHVRVMVGDRQLFAPAMQGLRVAYTDPAHAVDDVTTLDGSKFEITAPSSVLDQLILQGAVYVDGLDQPNLLNETPNMLPVSARRARLPSSATAPSYATGDGHRLFSYVPPTDCGCEELAGTYGKWLVAIEVQGTAVAQRTQIAALFRADETPDGFLTLDPITPMHVGSGPGSEVVLDQVDLVTSLRACTPPISVEAHTPDGFAVHYYGDSEEIWCDTNSRVEVTAGDDPTRSLVNEIHVQRLDS